MSSENVEIVRRVYEAFGAGGIEAIIDDFHPEIVWEDLDVLPGATVYRGHDELRQSVRRFYEAWGDLSFTAEELIDAGDAVVIGHRWQGTGKSSGTPIDTLVWNVLWLRDGQLVHRRAFQDRDAAFEAAGLTE